MLQSLLLPLSLLLLPLPLLPADAIKSSVAGNIIPSCIDSITFTLGFRVFSVL